VAAIPEQYAHIR